jgi:signal transduction histidine kinase
VKADPDLLAQVVQNLVSNAIKYNSDGGFIRLELARTSTGVRLAVTNSGEPIASEHQPRLFDRFYRADSSRTRATEGVGLGLSLAREIARAHGGELALDRSDASGTTFVLTLPT